MLGFVARETGSRSAAAALILCYLALGRMPSPYAVTSLSHSRPLSAMT